MYGRMIHVRQNGEYVRQSQIYDARGRVSLGLIDGVAFTNIE